MNRCNEADHAVILLRVEHPDKSSPTKRVGVLNTERTTTEEA